jgi:hypothetical protein
LRWGVIIEVLGDVCYQIVVKGDQTGCYGL